MGKRWPWEVTLPQLPRPRQGILHQSEIQDLFGPPRLTIEEKRFYFTLNDLELKSFASIRDRQQCCYFIVLLGYFKVKPVMLNVSFTDVREDLDFVLSKMLSEGEKDERKMPSIDRSQHIRSLSDSTTSETGGKSHGDQPTISQRKSIGLRRRLQLLKSPLGLGYPIIVLIKSKLTDTEYAGNKRLNLESAVERLIVH